MKQRLLGLLCLILIQTTYAYDAATIKMKIGGTINNNRYFLCMSGVGCLSLLSAKKGRTFPILNSVTMRNLYVLDVTNHLRLHPQGLPSSCRLTVKENQTLTLSGTLTTGSDQRVKINSLTCSVN